MIDAQVTRATCEIKCGDEVGTGWLVTSTQVVTAFHCVEDAISVDKKINLRFETDKGTEEVNASLLVHDETLDVCILTCEREMDLTPILLDVAPPSDGSRFSAFGFPVVKLSTGHRLEGTVSRVLDVPKLGIDLDLHVDTPDALTNYEGISGAALICNGRCQGMLRIGIDKALGAISVARMAEFFREHSLLLEEPQRDKFDDQKLASREEFAKAFEALITATAGGYVFIEGAHGIGKSTYCNTYRPTDPTLVYFGTYSFTSQMRLINPTYQAQPEIFFDWLNTLVTSHLTGKAGRVSQKSYPQLIAAVKELLDILGQSFLSQGKIGVIFLDGLDEVAKLGEGTIERLIGLLPSQVPAGLAFIFSAPNYANLSTVLGERIGSNSCITMPSLAHNVVRAFCARVLLSERSNAATIRIICDRAQGHPLYLRYLIDLANEGVSDDHLAALPLIDGSIRIYYEALWSRLQKDSEIINLLAIIARLRWGISTQQLTELLSDAEKTVLVTTLSRIQHLLLRRDETTIYHSSFADFLIEKTSLRGLDVQQRLTQYCEKHPDSHYGALNIVYHSLRSGVVEEAKAVAICKQDWVDRCVMLGAEPDTLLADVDDTLASATRQGSLVEVVRILLLAQRLQFRYDTLFAQSADLAANALLFLGKTQEALKHIIRYDHLIVSVPDALRLAYRLIISNEPKNALDLLEKAEAVVERQFESPRLRISDFIVLFDLKIQLILLKECAGDDDAMDAWKRFYLWSIDAIDSGISDKGTLKNCKIEMTGNFSASMACLANRYAPVSVVREHMSGSTDGLEQTLLRLLANYQGYCEHYGVAPNHDLLALVFADLDALLKEIGSEWEMPHIGIIDALVTLDCSSALTHTLSANRFEQLVPLQLVKTDRVTMDDREFYVGMAQWRLASLLDKNLLCPISQDIHAARWLEGIDLICRALAWCDGAARRAKEVDDKAELQTVWSHLELHVFNRLRFTLAQRVTWEDSYAIPEALIPQVYERLSSLIANAFPDRLSYMLTFIEDGFSVQCGLYSEGFRRVLSEVLETINKSTIEPNVEDQVFKLLQRWKEFVKENVKNRHELVPDLLSLVPLFVQVNAEEEAQRTYQDVLAVSMGPTWYKEDQLTLMTETLERIPKTESLEAGILARVAGLLESASGEMTFQRFVRYNKSDLVAVLCQRENYANAVRYLSRQTCGTNEQLLIEATEGNVDRISPLRGMRFPGCALDEQAVIHRILKSTISIEHWPLCWALLEIFQFGDRRHLSDYAEVYASLMILARNESDIRALMTQRMKFICESELEAVHRKEFLSSLQKKLPSDLQSELEVLFKVEPNSDETPEFNPNNYADDMGDDESSEDQTESNSSGDSFVMPGMFGSPGSSQESIEALARAEKLLARGNTAAAQAEAVSALECLQRGGWSIWGNHSAGATRAEDILCHKAESAGAAVKLYAPLILNERYTEKWRRANHLVGRIAGIATSDERAALARVVVEHSEIIVGVNETKIREYGFLDEAPDIDASASLIQLLFQAIDHPQWLRREKAAEMVQWLCQEFPQYIPKFVPTAFSMSSGNLPDVLCGVFDRLSASNALQLWDLLEPALDHDLQCNCKHVGRVAVLLRIADRAAQKGSPSAAVVREHLRARIPQSENDTHNFSPTDTQCPSWALIVRRQWRELNTMGLATQELVERATTIIQEVCTPLSIETNIELEQLLAEGFRDNSEHPLGRWMAKVRYALQVALLPMVSEELLFRVEKLFRSYNPVLIERLRVNGFSSPSKEWLGTLLDGQGGVIKPISGNNIYLDFFERVWVGGNWRLLRLTAFLCNTNAAPTPPARFAEFLSTETSTLKHATRSDACSRVKAMPAFLGSFTPAIPSDTLMQMTGASSTDLTRAYWRIGRVSADRGAGPEHEGCFLAINRTALRLPNNIQLAWVCEIDGIQFGTITYRY